MADWGLLAGIGEGLKQGLLSYREAKQYQDQQKKEAEREKFELAVHGMQKTPEGSYEYSPGFLEREKQKQQQGLIEKGFIPPGMTEEQMPQVNQAFFKAKQEADPTRQIIQQLQMQKGLLDVKKGKKEAELGEKIPASQVAVLSEGVASLKTLPDMHSIINQNKDLFGPISGRFSSANPYNERAQTVEAQIRSKAQEIGKFMEGGVLRKEDESKYRKMLPNLSDTPEVASNKLVMVERLLQNKINEQKGILKGSGYDVSGIPEFQKTELPEVVQKKGLLGKGPKPGSIEDGYKFLGGDPADPKSWEKVK